MDAAYGWNQRCCPKYIPHGVEVNQQNFRVCQRMMLTASTHTAKLTRTVSGKMPAIASVLVHALNRYNV